MTVSVGWSRYGYNVGPWNESPDVGVIITGQSISTNLNWGLGWGREEWGVGPWNEGLGGLVIGDGNIFIEDGQSISSLINNISVSGSSTTNITGEELTISSNTISVLNEANVIITGEELTISQGGIAIQAGGSITIQTGPEIDLEVNLGNVIAGTANFLQITGQELNISLNNISGFITDQILTITGEELNSSVNTISVSGSSPVTITGNSMTISLSNANISTQQILSITGNQANVSIATLKFWDPILPTNTEIWTNIH